MKEQLRRADAWGRAAHGLQGRDGRMVAIYKGKHGVQDAKGRMKVKS